MNTEQLKTIVKDYFKAFSNQDIDSLSALFSEDVTLRDWEIKAEGKENVLKANQGIFDSVKSIEAKINRLIAEENHVACDIDIIINEGEVTLFVVDLIGFNDQGKISSVTAFKGN